MQWAADIAFIPFLGLNVLGWLGILAFVLLCLSAALQVFKRRSPKLIKFTVKWHSKIAATGLGIAFLHGLLAILTKV